MSKTQAEERRNSKNKFFAFNDLFTPAECLPTFVAIPKIDVTETTNDKEFNIFPGAQIAMDGRTRSTDFPSCTHCTAGVTRSKGRRIEKAEANFKITVFF